MNESLEKIDSEERVDSRSYEDQNKELLPTVHLGVAAVNLEKRADRLEQEGVPLQLIKRSDAGNMNREVQGYNRVLANVKKEVQALVTIAEGVKNHICSIFRRMKNQADVNETQQRLLLNQKNELDQELIGLSGQVQYYKMENVKKKKDLLKEQIQSFNHILHPRRSSDLKKQMEQANQEQDDLTAYLERIQKDSGLVTKEALDTVKNQTSKLKTEQEELSEKLDHLSLEQKNLIAEYRNGYDMLPDDLKEIIHPALNQESLKEESEVHEKYRGR